MGLATHKLGEKLRTIYLSVTAMLTVNIFIFRDEIMVFVAYPFGLNGYLNTC